MTSAGEPTFVVEVVRSSRRRRTVDARLRGDVLQIRIPGWMSSDEERRWVEKMTTGFQRRTSAERLDLPGRARRLARRYSLPEPVAIVWSDRMTMRWGSCSASTSSITLSTRLARFPDWVVDGVIVHELCHLVEANHGPRFHQLAARYPLMERSIGFLIAKGGDADLD